MMRPEKGQRFARWVCTGIEGRTEANRIAWQAVCDCGTVGLVDAYSLRSGGTQSCGCMRGISNKSRATHGMTGSREYVTWRNMKSRCHDEKDKAYGRYGAIGITVCRRWRSSFANFYADMGDHPGIGYSIERINNKKGYSPSNCRWATPTEQARNMRTNHIVRFRGKRMCVAEAAELAGINVKTVYTRLYDGWDEHRALNTPSNGHLLQRTGAAQ